MTITTSQKNKKRDLYLSKDFVIVALDQLDISRVRYVVDLLGDSISFYKIGMELFYHHGKDSVEFLKKAGKKIFLDLKIHDIPVTVSKSVEVISKLGVDYLTLFTQGEQLQSAREIVDRQNSSMKLLNVTVLTSEKPHIWTRHWVKKRAKLSCACGAHGIICSGRETEMVRKFLPFDFLIINPGIRRKEDEAFDQKRVVTPQMAFQKGASHIVVGRPITQAKQPVQVVESIFSSLKLWAYGPQNF